MSSGTSRTGTSRRPVLITVLTEEHGNEVCIIGNHEYLNDLLVKNQGPKSMLFVHEGSSIHACFSPFTRGGSTAIARHSLIEHPEGSIRDIHRFSKFLLTKDIMHPGITAPSGETVDEKFHIERMDHDGYVELMAKIPDGRNRAVKLIRSGLNGTAEFDTLFNDIIKDISEGSTVDADVKDLARTLLEHGNPRDIERQIQHIRDRELMAKVIERVESDKTIKHVVMIIGAIHYRNIESIIKRSTLLLFDETESGASLHRLDPHILRQIGEDPTGTGEATAAGATAAAGIGGAGVTAAAGTGGAGTGGAGTGGAGTAAAGTAAATAPLSARSSIKELRAAAKASGINIVGIAERGELVEALRTGGVVVSERRNVRKTRAKSRKNRRTRRV